MSPLIATPGARYGRRGRVGWLQPGDFAENNPYEFYLMAPEGVSICVTQLAPMPPLSGPQPFSEAITRLEVGLQRLVSRHVDVIVQAGTPHISQKGWGFEDELRARVGKITDLPFITDIGASIKAMGLLRIKRAVEVDPFNDEIHKQMADYLGHAGIEVVHALSLRRNGVELDTLGSAEMSVISAGVKEAWGAASGADGVWITGAAMPSVAVIESLENELGVPVVSSMQAMTWAAVRALGINEKVSGFGRLWQIA
jgi:maleate isomerase